MGVQIHVVLEQIFRPRPIVTSVSLDVDPHTNREIVHNLDERYEGESYEQTEQSSHTGQEVHDAVQLVPLRSYELEFLEEELHACHFNPAHKRRKLQSRNAILVTRSATVSKWRIAPGLKTNV